MPVMPQVPESDGWIRSDQLTEVPHGRLKAPEVDAFLDFLFGDVARRPIPLHLRETAGVVRYLRLLACKGVPRGVANRGANALREYYESKDYQKDVRSRAAAENIAKVLWGDLSQWGQIKPCTKDQALRFVSRHSETYLASHPQLAPALKVLAELEVPPPAPHEPEPFKPPSRMSRSLNAQGSSNPRLQDDLSERICAAFYALQRANLKKIRNRLADALDKAGVPRRSDSTWACDVVNERIKEYRNGQLLAEEHLKKWQDQLVDKWITLFRRQEDERQRTAH